MSPKLDVWQEGRVLAPLPPLILIGGSLAAWVFQGLGLIQQTSLVALPTLLAGFIVLVGAILGLIGSRGLKHPSWTAFGLSSVSLFTVALVSQSGNGNMELQELALPPLALYVRMFWVAIALIASMVIGGKYTHRTVLYFVLFLAGEITRFPILFTEGGIEAQHTVLPILFLALVAVVESVIIAKLITLFLKGNEMLTVLAMIVLLVVHPLATAWQFALAPPEGMSGTAVYFQWIQGAEFSLAVFLVIIFVLHRLVISLRRGLE
jgi:hypothetical protein